VTLDSSAIGQPSPGHITVAGDSDHFVLRPCAWAGGVCDRGMVHATNQDCLAMAAGVHASAGPIAVVAVSDGVSTSAHAGEAARLAASVAAAGIADVLQVAEAMSLPDLGHRVREAFVAANDAILAAAADEDPGSWACTLALAVWWRGRVLAGGIGDSRCYWVPRKGTARLLTTDDSLAQARIELGIARQVAETGAQAHAILKWLGPGAGDPEPSLQAFDPDGPGWLVVCSDGLWNYASAPSDLQTVVREASAGDPALGAWQLADRLVEWANRQGGHDNVTVGIVEIPPAGRPARP